MTPPLERLCHYCRIVHPISFDDTIGRRRWNTLDYECPHCILTKDFPLVMTAEGRPAIEGLEHGSPTKLIERHQAKGRDSMTRGFGIGFWTNSLAILALVIAEITAPAVAGAEVGLPLADSARIAQTVDEMAFSLHIHGVSYIKAHSLGPGAIPRLRAILRNSSKKEYWANATAMLGSIGTRDCYIELQDFIWKRFQGEIDKNTYSALTSAVSVLGFTDGDGNPDLLRSLVRGAKPAYWARLPWRARGVQEERLCNLLSRLSLRGIGYLAGDEARRAIVKMGSDPAFSNRKREIAEALALNDEVTQYGLENYMMRHLSEP